MGLVAGAFRLLAVFRGDGSSAERKGRTSRLIDHFVDRLIENACTSGASEIHLQSTEREIMIYLRIDGHCREKARLPKAAGPDLVARLKAMSNPNLRQRGFPRERRLICQKSSTMKFDLRLSTAPNIHGEGAVIRLRAKSEALTISDELPARTMPPLAWLLRKIGQDPWHQRPVLHCMEKQVVSRNLRLIKSHLNRGGTSESYAPFVSEIQQRSTQPEDIEFTEPGYLEAVSDLNLFLQITSVTTDDLLKAFTSWHAAATQRLLDDEYRSELSHRAEIATLLAVLLRTKLSRRNIYGVVSSLYYDLHKLHPFAGGGNHRAIILLVNYVLLKNGKTPFYLKPINFSSYKTLTANIRSKKGGSAIKAELASYFRRNCPDFR
jgi:hypothetical protein